MKLMLEDELTMKNVEKRWFVVCVGCRERQNQSKANRRLEKKGKENAVQMEEERARADQFKNEVCCYYHTRCD